MTDHTEKEFASIVIRLLRGPMYDEESLWSALLIHKQKVSAYLGKVGLKLNIHEADGFAFVNQPDGAEDEESLPRLIRRMPLTFEVSLLSVILREELEAFDAGNTESRKLFMTKSQLRGRIAIYYKEKTDQTRLYRELDKHINKVKELGFLKELPAKENRESLYEVSRIIKAKIDPAFLEEFKEKMKNYVNTL